MTMRQGPAPGAAHRRRAILRPVRALLPAALLVIAACLWAPSPARAAAQSGPCWNPEYTGPYAPAATVQFGGHLSAGASLYSPLMAARYPGRGLHSYLLSPDGDYMLVMQDDTNLVLYRIQWEGDASCGGVSYDFVYDNLGAVWASGSVNWYDVSAWTTMQSDGNLVTYCCANALWASGTDRSYSTGYRLEVQDDGNLVIYLGNQAIWDRYNGTL